MSQRNRNSLEEERRSRQRTTDRSVGRAGKAREDRTDLGLALLERRAIPGVGLCQEDIAIWCGCSRGGVYQMERRAMKKLANLIRFGPARAVWEELAS